MAETPNLKLYVTPPGDLDTNVFDWAQKVSGDNQASNMMLIDALLGQAVDAATWDEYLPGDYVDG